MEVVLDTNAISDYMNGIKEVRDQLRGKTTVSVPTIVIGEYLAGLEGGSARFGYRERFASFLEDCLIAPVSRETAVVYAKLSLELKRVGRPIPSNDRWIAAVAIERNATLLSRDRHFEHIDGLRWLGWT